MNKEQLETALRDEWGNMHHNASLARTMPDFQNEYEYKLFVDCLRDYVTDAIDTLVDSIENDFGEKLTFYQYGRQGATIAPDDYMAPAPCNNFGSLNYTVHDGLDGYNHGRKLLRMFRYINQYWKNTAKYVPEWWTEMKEANDYQPDIDAHNGLKPIQTTVWVLVETPTQQRKE